MNLPTITKLPQYLAHLASKLPVASLAQGISAGGHPRISIKGSRFRLQSISGDEVVVPQMFLDVVIVDQNPNGLSKIFYAKKWDSSTPDGLAPDCFSDNGVGPSDKAASPQHSNCAQCPNNVWGSKVNETSGKQSKACGDVKKLAVLIAANPTGPVFELRVPGDSLKGLAAYATGLDKHGVPFSTVITRLTFDTNVSHQRLAFNPAYDQSGQMPYITEEMAEIVSEIIGTDEVDQCTGAKDKPVTARALGAAVGPSLAEQQAKHAAYVQQQNATAPGSILAQVAPPSPLPLSAGIPATEVPRRTRRTKAEMEAANQKVNVPQPQAAEIPAFLRNVTPPTANNAATVAPLSAPVTNAALDETIARLMSL